MKIESCLGVWPNHYVLKMHVICSVSKTMLCWNRLLLSRDDLAICFYYLVKVIIVSLFYFITSSLIPIMSPLN